MELKTAHVALVGALVAAAAAGCGDNASDAGPDLGAEAAIGQEFVRLRGCPTCHQSETTADGTLSGRAMPLAGTMAFPPNLTPDTATGIGGWADIEIIRAMRYGVDNQQAPLCPPMPHFDGTDPSQSFMTDVEANAIIAYLRSLPVRSRAVPSSLCPPLKPEPPLDMAAPVSPPDLAQVDHD